MFQFLLISYNLIISILFMQMKHPLAMGLTLLIQTTTICLISGMMSKTFWFSYTLFLIFLGGMLVLFIYVTSLASNEMFNFSMKTLINCSIIMMIINLIFMKMDTSTFNFFINNLEMNKFTINNFINENSISLIKLYNFPTNLLTLILINYLFLTMIIIVKITNNFMGPLRQMN